MVEQSPKDKKITIRWSIKWKLIAIMTILMVSLVAILTYIQISSQTQMLEDELNKRITLMKANLIERGKSVIVNLIQQVENDIAAFNFSGAMEAVKVRAENNEEIKYAILMDSTGMVLINTLDPDSVQGELTERDTEALNQEDMTVMEYKEGDESVVEIVHPIQISTQPWGVLRLIYTLEHLDKEIRLSRGQRKQEINKMVYRAIVTSGGFIAVSFIIVFFLSIRVSNPLVYLTHSARNLSKGDFSVSTSLQEIRSKDEVGVLAATFIEMSNDLKDSYEKLEDYSRTLEQKVEERTLALKEKNEALADTLQKLKTTQNQLIINEKLASLGALTAGIAHEIKNPLNFVNNFAQLTIEMVQDLVEEIDSQKAHLDQESAEEIEIMLDDLTQTADKINQHGQRADKIVQGMLAHSREETGERHLIDLNTLLDEYVNLAYHGIRAKDADFKVMIEKNYDQTIGMMNLVAQDLSRVFLNIVNNACYSVDRRRKEGNDDFSPMIWVRTKNFKNRIEISIRDNGIGIAPEVVDKIFDPFFTTKPAGEGTGLGLSISYDIVVHVHQGEIKVDTKEGEFAELTIVLPKDEEALNSENA
jgi:signal transduction histidine kinase